MYIYDVLYHWIVKLGNETWMNSERTMLGCLSTISRPNISGCVPVSNGDRMYPEISHQSYQRVPAAFIELQFLQIHRIIWPSSRGVTSNTSNNLDVWVRRWCGQKKHARKFSKKTATIVLLVCQPFMETNIRFGSSQEPAKKALHPGLRASGSKRHAQPHGRGTSENYRGTILSNWDFSYDSIWLSIIW